MDLTLIGIAGPSGSGKSRLAHQLAAVLEAPIVSLDNYYRNLDHLSFDERAASNFDEPAALEDELLLQHVSDLASGRAVDLPSYDFANHTRVPGHQRILPRGAVILEGLFTLYWSEIRRLLRLSIYVELEDETCYSRRLARDVRERGRTPDCVLRQYEGIVRPMAEQYIWPTRRYADVVIRGDAQWEDSMREIRRFLA